MKTNLPDFFHYPLIFGRLFSHFFSKPYLVEEVLERQSQSIRAFLLRTSLLQQIGIKRATDKKLHKR